MAFQLNPAQREAVRYLDGPLLVLAGAGSGKTRVITAKIGHLVERGHDAGRIVAITFTNKAAREMRERVDEMLRAAGRREAAAEVAISTFHALGLRIIRGDAKALGLKPGFSVLGPDDTEAIVTELLATTDRARARAAQWQISRWKNALTPPGAALSTAQSDDELAAARAYQRYDDTLRAYQAVDFDDLIALPIALLESDAAAAAKWRGEERPRPRRRVPGHEPGAVPAAAAARRHRGRGGVHRGRRRRPGDLRLARRDGRQPRAARPRLPGAQGRQARAELPVDGAHPALGQRADRPQPEALRQEAVERAGPRRADPRRAGRGRRGGGGPRRPPADRARFEQRGRYGDYAILYRGNHQAKVFEQALRGQNIPYTVSGGQSYFDRAEIKDLVAYLRLVANEDDDPAFIRAITTPKRGFGATAMERLGTVAGERHESLFAAAFAPEAAAAVPARQREVL